ncbi:hypothetical protein GCL60_10295 [Silvanigrella paludirubra]|uniref:Lipoprotein n=1 Tax=Silvanigrella paludirubra TaxID=2499159 RepID=A0A6N6VRA9_9BACT|nr:hypothetical protein [Silvanigrella paludirubra]KAB8037558.1 hypothetical protein GCL60_10295 [Silvanigrella paludirubra]
MNFLKKNTIKITCLFAASLSIVTASCTSTSNPNNAQVYLKKDINVEESKVIVFPVLYMSKSDFENSNKNFNGNLLDAKFAASWVANVGKENVIPVPRVVLNEIPKSWEVLNILVSQMDNAEKAKDSIKGTVVESFINSITEKYGKYTTFAFSVVFENEDAYKSSNKVYKNMGLFDPKSLSWKWITKDHYEASKFMPVPYAVAVNDVISNSFEALKKENNNKIN